MERNYKLSGKKDNKEKISYKKIIITVILLVIAISSSFIVFFALQVALGTSNPVVVVISGSMEPNIYKGDLLFVQGIDAENIRNGTAEDQDGDVIVFYARWLDPNDQAVPVVHRVVNKTYEDGEWKFQTKGDNILTNPEKDYGGFWTSEQDILGVMVNKVPYIGWVKILLTDEPILTYLLIGVIIILVISLGWDMSKENKINGGKKKKKEIKSYLNYSPNSWKNDYVNTSVYSPLPQASTPPRPPRYSVPHRLENSGLKQRSDPASNLSTSKRQDNIHPPNPRGPTAAPAGHNKYFATRPKVSPNKKLNQVASRGLTAKSNNLRPIPRQQNQAPTYTPPRQQNQTPTYTLPRQQNQTPTYTLPRQQNQASTYTPPRQQNQTPTYTLPRQQNQASTYTPPRQQNQTPTYTLPRQQNQASTYTPPRQQNQAPTYAPQPQPSQITHPNIEGYVKRRKCPRCGATGFNIKEVDDKTRLISYIPSRIYAKKKVCKMCSLEF